MNLVTRSQLPQAVLEACRMAHRTDYQAIADYYIARAKLWDVHIDPYVTNAFITELHNILVRECSPTHTGS